MIPVKACAAFKPGEPLRPFELKRREPGDHDVVIDIAYCGICHSDIHAARGEWGEAAYPMVPGHEIAGEVSRVGAQVSKFKPGERAGVGCFIDTCRTCEKCRAGLEVYCENHISFTYNGTEQDRKTPTFGGYSSRIVVDEAYALKIPAGAPLERVAPLLCAGITTYSPINHWKIGRGQRLGVVGLGGLGHLAVKIAAAKGAEVFVFSSSRAKGPDARRLGAREFVLGTDARAMKSHAGRLDFILNTVPGLHAINDYLELLRADGTMILVGASPAKLPLEAFSLIMRRRRLAGSLIGGIAETQEMIDFCVRHNALADVEVIPASRIDESWNRVVEGKARFRFSIEMRSL